MKSLLKLFGSLTMLVSMAVPASALPSGDTPADGSPVKIWSSPELEAVSTDWINGFSLLHPDKVISFETAGRLDESIMQSEAIGLIRGKDLKKANVPEAWKIPVGREVIVAVMNAGNPFRKEIEACGLSAADLASVFTNTAAHGRGVFSKNDKAVPVALYVPDDEQIRSYLADFTQTGPAGISFVQTGAPKDLPGRIMNDKSGVGFCRLADLQGFKGSNSDQGLVLVPLDINGNNRLDPFEDMYGSTDELIRGVWIGKYPRSLYSRIYAVSGTEPAGDASLFVSWILFEGQSYLALNGFTMLTASESQSGLKYLISPVVKSSEAHSNSPVMAAILTVSIVILAGFSILFLMIRLFRERAPGEGPEGIHLKTFFRESSVTAPRGLFFDRSHTWAFMQKDGRVMTGIDDFLPRVTGRVTRVKMRGPGDVVRKGEVFLSLIQNGKQLDILSPVSGTIVEQNQRLLSNASLISTDPLQGGWVYRIEPLNWLKEIRSYLMGQNYSDWINTEFTRLKDFLGSVLKSGMSEPVLQEGGELKNAVLESLGPDVWEEFQTGFINLSR